MVLDVRLEASRELFGLQVPENSAVVPVSVVTEVTVQSRCAPVKWFR